MSEKTATAQPARSRRATRSARAVRIARKLTRVAGCRCPVATARKALRRRARSPSAPVIIPAHEEARLRRVHRWHDRHEAHVRGLRAADRIPAEADGGDARAPPRVDAVVPD